MARRGDGIYQRAGARWLFVAATVALLAIASAAHAESIQQWRTPSGSSYFGDSPPSGSTLVGSTGSLATSGGGDVDERDAHQSRKRGRSAAVRVSPPRSRPSDTATGVARDRHGKIQRSASAKNEFKRAHPCPSTGATSGPCPGYVIDHVSPLKRGGLDAPVNMQWQSIEDAKAKDKLE